MHAICWLRNALFCSANYKEHKSNFYYGKKIFITLECSAQPTPQSDAEEYASLSNMTRDEIYENICKLFPHDKYHNEIVMLCAEFEDLCTKLINNNDITELANIDFSELMNDNISELIDQNIGIKK